MASPNIARAGAGLAGVLLGCAAAAAQTAPAPTAPAPAPATRTIESRGLWSVIEGTDIDGRPLCGITTVGADGRSITIAQHPGETGLDLVLAKPTWEIPDATPIDIAVQYDGAAETAMHGSGSGTRVTVQIPFDSSIPFMRGFRRGSVLKVLFPTGDEPPWTGGLSGSSAAVDAFNQCRGRFPVAPGAATQPFNTPPQPAPQPAPSVQPVPGAMPGRT